MLLQLIHTWGGLSALHYLQIMQAWAIDAAWYRDTLFLDINKTPDANETYPNQERMTYYGYKFEALCTGGLH